MRNFALSLTLFALFALAALTVRADCPDGTTGDDTIVCSTNPPTTGNADNQLDGDLGDDTLIVEDGVTVSNIDGDGQDSGDEFGDGDGGDDLIINNGTVSGGILGDYATGDGGDDTIINNGTTAGIYADSSFDGGDDLIINNGTAGEIYGDDVSGEGGDDTIINNGNAGYIDGEGGNDQITIGTGGGGIEGELYVNGGDGVDTFTIDWQTDDASDFHELAAAISDALDNSADGVNGYLYYKGEYWEWYNFEQFINLLRFLEESEGGPGYAFDPRVNSEDVAAPVAIYCAAGGGLDLYLIGEGGNGVFLYHTALADLNNALATGVNTLVVQSGGYSVWAIEGGLIQVMADDGSYVFIFALSECLV